MTPKGYHTSTVIAAPPIRVWQVLTDFASYPDWNPLVARVDGEPGLGRRIDVHITPLGRVYRPRITVWEPPHRLSWSSWEVLPLLLTSVHYFRLEATDEGWTRLHHGERFRGLATPLLRPLLMDRMHQAFTHHDLALKQRIEGSRG